MNEIPNNAYVGRSYFCLVKDGDLANMQVTCTNAFAHAADQSVMDFTGLQCACDWCRSGNVIRHSEMANYERWVDGFANPTRKWWQR